MTTTNKAKILESTYTKEELAKIAAATEIELDEVTASLAKALSVLRYYKNDCSGDEPSISVFQRDLDEVLGLTPKQCLASAKSEALTFFVEQVEDAQASGFISNKSFVEDLKACVISHIEIHYEGDL